jgi:formylglycine-generating enzyme required for sulfatase activity
MGDGNWQARRRDQVMKGTQYTGIIVAVILGLLLVGGLIYRGSVESRRKAEEKRRELDRARIEKEAERRKAEVEEVAEKVPEEVAPAVSAAPTEPSIPVPMPPPIADANCQADSPQVVKQSGEAAPAGMVYVPTGAFIMGSSAAEGHPDETPPHRVCLSGFYIDKHEVTNAQFKEFTEASGYVTEAEKGASAADDRTWRHPYGPESNAEDMPNHPVVCISWNDANAYALWAGKRLPTEAEWEKAARGTDSRRYPWGNAAPTGTLANIADKSIELAWSNASLNDNHRMASPVGSFPDGKSAYGIEDMGGNVWEWCFDWWSSTYYETGASNNPVGPESGEFKVVRGGSWFSGADGARAAQRMHFRPNGSSAAIGFRCVKDIG